MPDSPPVVLLIHNEDQEASELQSLLERNIGCKTTVTWSGSEALRLLRGRHFDVVITNDYVADIYLGDLIERASALASPPQVLVLGDEPTPGTISRQNLGKCTFVEKHRPRAILQAIASGSVWKRPVRSGGGGSSGSDSGQKFDTRRELGT
ncbi:MAG TPA: hypothetical protein VMD77_06180 [Candidatus Baltobacteraceae bacterium]|jgi:DNA-binding NarL/FixJ family response regulator|nr:hypothetical protein [Candidatus Baltobacteraceae bacterium]